MVCYGHGMFGIVDISLAEEGVNQGTGVVGGRVWEMLICQWFF